MHNTLQNLGPKFPNLVVQMFELNKNIVVFAIGFLDSTGIGAGWKKGEITWIWS